MNVTATQPVQTIPPPQTIWHKITQDAFRANIVALEERTNGVPVESTVFPIDEGITVTETDTSPNDNDLRLPLKLEQQLADDIAVLAAVNEGAQSVAAACIEQQLTPNRKLTVRIAAADSVDEHVKDALVQIVGILMDVASRGTSTSTSTNTDIDTLFTLIIHLHTTKLLGRLRSSHWVKPRYLAASHKKALHQDFENMIHRVQHIYPKRRDRPTKLTVEARLRSLAACYARFEHAPDSHLLNDLKTLVSLTFAFCHDQHIRHFASQLASAGSTSQLAAAIKTLRQLEKIGAYYRIARDLIRLAARYPVLFDSIELRYLTPYPSQPTSIAYEPWASTTHVHAEIQLVVYYDLQQQQQDPNTLRPKILPPRIIGTSKYLCYLCHLFIQAHGTFVVANTHGRLYDQWTVPDLAGYSEGVRGRYRDVLAAVNERVVEQLGGRAMWRVEPMTSRQDLLLDEGGLGAEGEREVDSEVYMDAAPA